MLLMLEELVSIDMILNGYSPHVKEDVDKYWQERL
jgi:hypothetical protein